MYPAGFDLAADIAANPTIFGKLLRGEIPATLVHEDAHCIAFRDIMPMAPTHILVIPRRRIISMADIGAEEAALLGHLMQVIAQVAAREGLTEGGFRVVTNTGTDGGQTVPHLHFHLLGGRQLQWPPG